MSYSVELSVKNLITLGPGLFQRHAETNTLFLTCRFVASVPRPAIPIQHKPGNKSHGISEI